MNQFKHFIRSDTSAQPLQGCLSSATGTRGSSQARNPGLEDTIPLGLQMRSRFFWGTFCLALLLALTELPAPGQTVFFDFNTVGHYTNNFNPWNDNGASGNGNNYSFSESTNAGVGSGGGVSVFQSNDTTATYKNGSWNFATNNATIAVSVLIHANGQSSGNKVQLGIINSNYNGFNSNPNVAFD